MKAHRLHIGLLSLWLILVFGTVNAHAADTCSPDPFTLRTSIEHGAASKLCRALYLADIDSKNAVQQLLAILADHPDQDSAYEAHLSLFELYMREGKYGRAVLQMNRLLAVKPDEAKALDEESLVHALARFPDLSVSGLKSSTIQGEWDDGLLHIPISINGSAATYIVDSGSEISAMSQSEAGRLGLKAISSSSRLTDGSGLQTDAVQVTNIADLKVGVVHLHNVRFMILPDKVRPFVRLPEREKGIIGLSPLIALQVLRLTPDAKLTIARVHPIDDSVNISLAFSSSVPVTQVKLDSTAFTCVLDTGAIHTLLYTAFARRFPKIMQRGTSEKHSLTGVGGARDLQSLLVPDIPLVFGRPVTLRAGTLILSGQKIANDWASANLGFDAIQQALPLTIDFQRMQISF